MIRSFRHAGLEALFRTGSKAGIQPKHAKRLRLQLETLSRASKPSDMAASPWRLHPLKGRDAGRWAVWVDENFRLTFAFDGNDAVHVDYGDYHRT